MFFRWADSAFSQSALVAGFWAGASSAARIRADMRIPRTRGLDRGDTFPDDYTEGGPSHPPPPRERHRHESVHGLLSVRPGGPAGEGERSDGRAQPPPAHRS